MNINRCQTGYLYVAIFAVMCIGGLSAESATPMFWSEEEEGEEIELSNVLGKKTVWSVVNPEMGDLTQKVVRADVIAGEARAEITLRGSGPPGTQKQLESELKVLLGKLLGDEKTRKPNPAGKLSRSMNSR